MAGGGSDGGKTRAETGGESGVLLPHRTSAYGSAFMLRTGILNPSLLALLARVRHTNMLVIADRGFPFWPQIETVDLSLVDGVPTVVQVLAAVRKNFVAEKVLMAEEFFTANSAAMRRSFAAALAGWTVERTPHVDFKLHIPRAVGLIRTGDTVQYANMILISG